MEFGGKFAYLNYSSGEESCEEDEVSAPIDATFSAPTRRSPERSAAPTRSPFGFSFGAAAAPQQSASAQPPMMQRMRAALSMSRASSQQDQQDQQDPQQDQQQQQQAIPSMFGSAPRCATPTSTEAPSETQPPIPRKQKKRVVFKKSIPNVFLVKLGTLGDDVAFATGDASVCQKCSAVMSVHSKCPVTPNEESQSRRVWNCEFCLHENELFIDEEEIPKEESLDYIIQPPPMQGASELSSNIVFCADISGSMCVTTEVPGKIALRGGPRLDHSLNTDGSNQYLPRQSRNVTYVSRLQCVQAGIDAQLSHLAKEEPDSTVALVTFSSDVTIVGDGETEAQVISGQRLDDQEDLFKFGKEYVLEKKVSETHKKLSKKLFDLQEQGPTALGPAVVAALGLASQKPRSRVIVCTDGLANVGLGAIDNKLESQAAMAFYEKIGELAKESGVSVSVIGIEGSDCFMECIGKLADITGGYVNIVNPLNITTDFANILSDPLVATNVSIKLILHHGLRFEDEEGAAGSLLEKSIGNVTRSTEFTFNYSVDKDNAELKEQKQLPFQIQIHFTKPDGTKCMRIITRVQAATTERQAAEASVTPAIVGLHNIRTAAKFASAGEPI
eukprot:TRINITY_DN69_c0_g1_i12.p1 TRINITY_DN69_c0_g1~~TRINITY_DN69_c0_g1_i12.p1  ORF type:complete len:615 (+),score=159.53 TRINITY_DN69_c0_g1_i12:58-1902(+)